MLGAAPSRPADRSSRPRRPVERPLESVGSPSASACHPADRPELSAASDAARLRCASGRFDSPLASLAYNPRKAGRIHEHRTDASRTIRVGHSPDSDDAFMFYALTHDKLDTGGLRFVHQLEDIETLNRRALNGELEVSAVSIHAFAHLADRYALLASGSSMGDRYGPTLITREPTTLDDLRGQTIAVPGQLTTAYLTLQLCLGKDVPVVVMPFDQILPAVAEGQVEAG